MQQLSEQVALSTIGIDVQDKDCASARAATCQCAGAPAAFAAPPRKSRNDGIIKTAMNVSIR
jgi:hypothetical protein